MGCGQGKENGTENTEDSILKCEENLCDFLKVTIRCYERQSDVARKLNGLADQLDELDRHLQKAQVGLSVAGSVLAVTGIGLSFVTFGASALVLTIAGLSMAAGAAGVATSIAEKAIKNERMKEANRAVLSYAQAVIEYAPALQQFCDSLSTDDERERLYRVLTDASVASNTVRFRGVTSQRDLCKACEIGHKIVSTSERVKDALGVRETNTEVPGKPSGEMAKFSLNMVTKVSTFSDKAFKALTPLAHGIKIGSHVLSGVGLILDIGTIVYYSIQLHRKQPSQVAQMLRKIAEAFVERT